MKISYLLVGGLFGLLFGSAINAMVWRLKVGRSWAKGRSECPDCGHVLAPKDLVPIASFMVLKGKCRYCHKPIQDRPIVELVAAVLFAVSAAVLAPDSLAAGVKLGLWAVILIILLVLAVYDAKWMELPLNLNYAFIILAFIFSATMAVMTHNLQVLIGAGEAAVLAGGFFWLLVHSSKGRAMGGGDIYLATGMGALLGVQAMAVAMLVAFNVGAVVGLVLILTRKRGRKATIAFGPYLVAGTIVAFLWGRELAAWYLQLTGMVY